MRREEVGVPAILDRLESFYGVQEPCFPTDPYLFLVWWHCGYPASDASCSRGWESLSGAIGVEPASLLKASPAELARVLRPGGMVPELRAMRIRDIAVRVLNEFGGDLRGHLHGPLTRVRKTLKQFPNIADPGADRILLFAGVAPLPAVPSNCPHVLVRIEHGQERENYTANYSEAAEAIATGVAETFDARTRAYLLLKCHGQKLCKRTKPKCDQCPVSSSCAFFSGKRRGRGTIE